MSAKIGQADIQQIIALRNHGNTETFRAVPAQPTRFLVFAVAFAQNSLCSERIKTLA
jgi:hypothetical protein